MAALTAPRNAPQPGAGEVVLTNIDIPLAANAKVFQGALVALSAGLGVAASTALGLVAAGLAHLDPAVPVADNTGGANSAQVIRVAQGVFRFNNSSSTDLIATADRGNVCYIVDDNTVAKTYGANGTRSVAGVIVDVDSTGVYVYVCMQEALAKTQPGAAEQLTANGAISLGTLSTGIAVSGAMAFTLGNGLYVGQRKRVYAKSAAATPNAVITPASAVGYSTLALTARGQFGDFEWNGTAWDLVAATGTVA